MREDEKGAALREFSAESGEASAASRGREKFPSGNLFVTESFRLRLATTNAPRDFVKERNRILLPPPCIYIKLMKNIGNKVLLSNLQKILQFSTILGKLKNMERFKGQFYWRDYPRLPRYESVADHSWRLAVLVMVFHARLRRKFDLTKALQMALLHDTPEILSGDKSPLGSDGTGKDSHAFNRVVQKRRHEEEKRAAKKLFRMLPGTEGGLFFRLWLEYEKQKSREAKIVKALDRLEAVIQVVEYRGGKLFPAHLEFNVTYGLRGSEVDPVIQEFGRLVALEMKRRFIEYKKVK